MSEDHPPQVGTDIVAGELVSTGERFIPGLGGMIELEHRHRYLFARQICAGKTTLDIACGEGYGSSMLAQTAGSVIGVDIAADAVAHARKHYGSSTVTFKVGSCAAIPLDDASIDVVVSFETIEHHDQHEEMMREVHRVLKPDGVLVLSSPERFAYSERPGTHNEFHVRELYRDEFVELVGRHFLHVDIYDQKVIFGSAILSETQATRAVSSRADALHEHSRGLAQPMFLIAVAADRIVPPLDTGVFEQDLAESSEWKWWSRTVEERDDRIRKLDAQVTALNARIAEQTIGQQRAEEANAAQQGSIQSLDAEIAELHARIAEQTMELARTAESHGEWHGNLRDLDAEIADLHARIADQTSELARTSEANAAQYGHIQALDAEVVKLHEGLAQAAVAETALASERLRLAEVETQRSHAEQGRQAALAKVIELQATVISLQDSLAQQRAALEREQQAHLERETQLTTQWGVREQALQSELAERATAFEARLRYELDTNADLVQRLAQKSNALASELGAQAKVVDRLAAREAENAAITKEKARLSTALARADALVEQLRGELHALHPYAAKLQWVLSTTQHSLDQSRAQMEHQRQHIDGLDNAIAALRRSTSWRVTAPLRYSMDALRAVIALPRRGARVALFVLRGAYRWMPVDSPLKEHAKDAFFHVFGFALGNTGTYAAWLHWKSVKHRVPVMHDASTAASLDARSAKNASDAQAGPGSSEAHGAPEHSAPPAGHAEQEPIPQLVEDVTVMAEPVTLLPTYSAAGAPLWVADGSREWLDLPTMRERIDALESARLQSIVPPPVPMVSMAGQDLRAVARALRFAAPAEPKVTILIPVYNKIEMTLECLLSIANADSDVTFEIIVADDASTDETPDILALVQDIRVHRNATNLHFLRNCNSALPMVRGEYVVFLNNDVQVQDRWLDGMLQAFTDHRQVGAVGPKILYPSGHLQEAGVAFNVDMTVDMVGLNDDPQLPRYNYARRVDYCSGACLMVPAALLAALGGFSEAFAPAYCEDGDLCLRIRQRGLFVYYAPQATVVHRLSATTAADDLDAKRRLVANSLVTFAERWQEPVEAQAEVRAIAFYLPQYYPFPENDRWWGKGFTEWTNVTKAQPNFVGHYQPHLPADLGYYDLRVAQTMKDQAALARRYGLGGFCFYYYWFAGKRLLDLPVERLLETGEPAFPFCLCWANENWTRRWDGQETHVLIAQSHTDSDDEAVIKDLIRFFRSPNYIRIDGRPLLVVYRVTLFPDFAKTAAHWRKTCIAEGIGEIYIAMVESFELVSSDTPPSRFGCDATVEFPPQGLAEPIPSTGPLINPDFVGTSVDYRALALRYCSRPAPAYTRFRGAMPGWDNTPRRQNNSYCIEHATPGGFQAWLEHIMDDTRKQHFGDERIVFINAWNEWAEGAHLEPDRRFGHTYLEALRNAKDKQSLLRMHRYVL